jgi:hypothetical protein
MRKHAVKSLLFTLTTGILSPFMAQGHTDDLRLLEELPLEARVSVYSHVFQHLKGNPELASQLETIAVDSKGNVYALDKDYITLSRLGQPSCIRREE